MGRRRSWVVIVSSSECPRRFIALFFYVFLFREKSECCCCRLWRACGGDIYISGTGFLSFSVRVEFVFCEFRVLGTAGVLRVCLSVCLSVPGEHRRRGGPGSLYITSTAPKPRNILLAQYQHAKLISESGRRTGGGHGHFPKTLEEKR